jgi:hypothetical protein
MAAKTYKWTRDRIPEVEAAIRAGGTVRDAARILGESHEALRFGIRALNIDTTGILGRVAQGRQAERKVEFDSSLSSTLQELRAELAAIHAAKLDDRAVREQIVGLCAEKPTPPTWLLEPAKKSLHAPGVPTLLCSDWHYSEVVDPAQIGGVNTFDLPIARKRIQMLAQNTVDVLKKHMSNPAYPGLVVAMAGDLMSGSIHEELSDTNESAVMPAFVDLHGQLITFLSTLADEFGNLYVPWVTGNHARTTTKPRAKSRAHTNYEWLLGQMLTKHFEKDKRIVINVSDGPDLLYRVYGHRYLLTHGDQFRGGDGLIGPIGPVFRGDNKKRVRNAAVEQSYDTLVLGHFHQLLTLNRLIMNGSLVGYNEYAYQGNFPYEPPKQALWITHPERGITMSMPIFVEPKKASARQEWVSWG